MSLFLLRMCCVAFTLPTKNTNTHFVWIDTIAPQSNNKLTIADKISHISSLGTLYVHENHGSLRCVSPKKNVRFSALSVHSNSTGIAVLYHFLVTCKLI